ncbi:Uncharacterised protein [[Ruminococcus] torques]|nr:Uncharacterised protein [[Ruminococcus] torques]SCJ58545.1 Uncharacterised protein [uncultured Ruminococcus sp.]
MKKINLRDYYPYYTQDMIVEVPDEVALLLREYTVQWKRMQKHWHRIMY